MTSALQATILVLVAAGGLAVVVTREPAKQAAVSSIFGLMLAALFFSYQAPDVALSQIVVGSVAVPAMILLALAKVRERDREREGSGEEP